MRKILWAYMYVTSNNFSQGLSIEARSTPYDNSNYCSLLESWTMRPQRTINRPRIGQNRQHPVLAYWLLAIRRRRQSAGRSRAYVLLTVHRGRRYGAATAAPLPAKVAVSPLPRGKIIIRTGNDDIPGNHDVTLLPLVLSSRPLIGRAAIWELE